MFQAAGHYPHMCRHAVCVCVLAGGVYFHLQRIVFYQIKERTIHLVYE